MIINSLLLLIVAMIPFLDEESKIPATIFMLPAIGFQILSPHLEASHYLIAAMLDWAVLFFLSRLVKQSLLTCALGLLSVFSIMLNMIGYIRYELYYSPDLYDQIYIIFYLLVAVTIMGTRNGGVKRSSNFSGFRQPDLICHQHIIWNRET